VVEGGAKHDPSSCGARIHVGQASKHSSSDERSVAGQGPGQWAWRARLRLGAVEVVVVRELDQDAAEVWLVDDDQVIKALSANRANEPLGDRIGVSLQLLLVGIFRDDSESLIPTIRRPGRSSSCSGTHTRGASIGSSS
jgi:hypothetical protein